MHYSLQEKCLDESLLRMSTVNERTNLDAIDQGILACVLANARATFAEIGDAVGLSAPATKRRVDRLLSTGAIRGFTAVVDPGLLGWHTEAYVEVFCKGKVSPMDLRRGFEKIPEVVSACTLSGSADALLRVLARDVQHLEQAIQRIRASAHVDTTKTEIVLSRLIDRGGS
jgi:DNA-binding Lrp family transcriptional regulator